MAVTGSTVTLKSDELNDLSIKLGAIDAQLETLAMLAATGDIESLKKGKLCATLLDVSERLTAAKHRLDSLHSSGG